MARILWKDTSRCAKAIVSFNSCNHSM